MLRSRRSGGASPIRALPPRIECLEARELLNASPMADLAQAALLPATAVRLQHYHEVRQHHDHGHSLLATASQQASATMHPLFQILSSVTNPNPPAKADTPSQVQRAYGFSLFPTGITADGTGQTIAIVDAYDDPNIQGDVAMFDKQYNLPDFNKDNGSPTLTIMNQTGNPSPLPSTDPAGGWELEEALDVEWAHAMAPKANIILVEATDNSLSNLLAAVDTAKTLGSVVSMSWGSAEFSGETNYDSHFIQPGVTFVASSGDTGAVTSWPAISPNVVAVGGTTLTLNPDNTIQSETGWSGSGGGISQIESKPSYQSAVTQSMEQRTNPDVAYNADPTYGYAVYDSVPYKTPITFFGKQFGTTVQSGWFQVGGTSAGAPQWSALIAIANQIRSENKPPLSPSPLNTLQVLTALYDNPGALNDITSGKSSSTGNTTSYSAGPGYDLVTGLGSPKAVEVVQALEDAQPIPPV